ncbi:hypothetical protein METHP14_550020 [Pseudomonas sp. P14-2025]
MRASSRVNPLLQGGHSAEGLCGGFTREEASTGNPNKNAPNQSGRFHLQQQRLTCLPSA